MLRGLRVMCAAVFVLAGGLLLPSCGRGEDETTATRCEAELDKADAVPSTERRPGLLFDSIVACKDLTTWNEHAKDHPGLFGGATPDDVARRVCQDPGDPRVHDTDICQNV